MKNNTILVIVLNIIAVLLGLFYIDYHRTPTEIIKSDTVTVHDTMWKDTTITKVKLVPKKIVEIKHDTVFDDKGDSIILATEFKRYDETLTSGGDTCEVSAFISGIHPSLDSLSMRLKTHEVTNTVTVTNYVEKPKKFIDRFHFGLQVGYGIGLKNKDFEPYVGIGGSFDL